MLSNGSFCQQDSGMGYKWYRFRAARPNGLSGKPAAEGVCNDLRFCEILNRRWTAQQTHLLLVQGLSPEQNGATRGVTSATVSGLLSTVMTQTPSQGGL